MGYSKESLSNDVVDQYTNHLQFIHDFQLEHDYALDTKTVTKDNDNTTSDETTNGSAEEPTKP